MQGALFIDRVDLHDFNNSIKVCTGIMGIESMQVTRAAGYRAEIGSTSGGDRGEIGGRSKGDRGEIDLYLFLTPTLWPTPSSPPA